ncbi:MAG TPA: formyltransferase [Rhodocyclaceae bacterium]|nr:formyltransferase [Rhodocyclaceae bacterium]
MTRAIVFAYHNVGVRCLSVLLAHGVDVACVVTHRDNPQETLWFDSVAELARLHRIPVIMPDDPNEQETVAELAALQPDFLFSFYYRAMLKQSLLDLPRHGAFNMHGSLLPKYRGRVPVNWAVLHGERETGASLHRMELKPDAGGIVAQQAVPILPDDTAFEVFQKVTFAAECVLDRALPDLLAGRCVLQPQDLRQGAYFGGRRPEDGRIDWSQSAQNVHNLIRAVAPPYPGAFFDTPQGHWRVLRSLHSPSASGSFGAPTLFADEYGWWAECGDGRVLRLLAVEFAGSLQPAATAVGAMNAIFGSTAIRL